MPLQNSEQSRWFEEHLQPHEAMLRTWLQSRYPTNSEIDDILQDAYVRVLAAREKGTLRSPKAFLFATARNLVSGLPPPALLLTGAWFEQSTFLMEPLGNS